MEQAKPLEQNEQKITVEALIERWPLAKNIILASLKDGDSLEEIKEFLEDFG